MKKVIRLTESDLVKIVKRVINEQNQNTHTLFVDSRTGFLRGVDSAFPLVNMTGNQNTNCKVPFTFNRIGRSIETRTIGIEGREGEFIFTGNINAKPGVIATTSPNGTAGLGSQGLPCSFQEAFAVGSPLNLYNKKGNIIKKGDKIIIKFVI